MSIKNVNWSDWGVTCLKDKQWILYQVKRKFVYEKVGCRCEGCGDSDFFNLYLYREWSDSGYDIENRIRSGSFRKLDNLNLEGMRIVCERCKRKRLFCKKDYERVERWRRVIDGICGEWMRDDCDKVKGVSREWFSLGDLLAGGDELKKSRCVWLFCKWKKEGWSGGEIRRALGMPKWVYSVWLRYFSSVGWV